MWCKNISIKIIIIIIDVTTYVVASNGVINKLIKGVDCPYPNNWYLHTIGPYIWPSVECRFKSNYKSLIMCLE